MLGLAAACLAGSAQGADRELVRWFANAAAPALQAAAPTNDAALAGRELLKRGLADALTRARQVAPAGLDFGVSLDPALQPRYVVSATQRLLTRTRHATAIDLHGQVAYDKGGRTDGDLGLRYQGRWHDQDVSLDVQGAMEDRWLVGLERYRLGAEGRLRSLEVRGNLYDDVPARPAGDEIAKRRLDAYDVALGAPLPFVSGARLQASRSWQVAVNGKTVTTADRVGLSLNSLLALEIKTDNTRSQPQERAWSTQLRWRVKLGG
jgi:hypothetical protein